MPRGRNITEVLRVAALRLLVVSVFFGPAGPVGSVSFASILGVSCPCDEAPRDEYADRHDTHAEQAPCNDGAAPNLADRGDGDPCEDECPDDCQNCECCMCIAMPVLPLLVTSIRATCGTARPLPPRDAPASGTRIGVFRPPRSLT